MRYSLGERGIRSIVLDVEGTTTPIRFVSDVLFPYARERLREFVDSDEAARMESLMDADSKDAVLKELQGKIWERGYRDGSLVGDVYADVPIALGRWHADGRVIAIYSSGSVLAQQLLFGHTRYGDLTRYIAHHFDTAVGAKREPSSYVNIAKTIGFPAAEIAFVSDIGAELDAAERAGMRTILSVRPGNFEQSAGTATSVQDFGEIVS